jgi:hypothetical protein
VGAAVVVLTAAPPGAHAAAPQTQPVANSAKGFVGCVSAQAWKQSTFTVYCLALQVPSAGTAAGRLTANAWRCRYTSSGPAFSASRVVLPSSALTVRKDGSFAFSSRLPAIGRISVAASGGEAENYAAPTTRLIGPQGDGYRPQGYTLASPTRALTVYGIDHTLEGSVTRGSGSEFVSATVNGQRQDELIGAAWDASTSGEWDFDTC